MRRLTFVLFFLSGAVALVYEVVWLRQLVLLLGSTHVAVTSVLTAFMAGLALGAFAWGSYADRSRWHPLLLFGSLEVGVGIFAFVVQFLLDPLGPMGLFLADRLDSRSGIIRFAAFVLPLVTLLPPTILMGGTLPMLSKFLTRQTDRMGSSVGYLYAVNTFGAVMGTALAGFFLIPWLGVNRTITIAASANFALGGISFLAARRAETVSGPTSVRSKVKARGTVGLAHNPKQSPKKRAPALEMAHLPSNIALWATAGTGFLALVYEIAWTRVLVLILGSSVYAFTSMLATFLTGLAAGASFGARLADRLQTRQRLVRALAATIALGALAGYVTLLLLPTLPSAFASSFDSWGLATDNVSNQRSRLFRLLALEFSYAFTVMLPATVFMGMVFPFAIRLWVWRADLIGRGVGTVYAANSGGTILGALAGGFIILPVAGLQGSILMMVAGGFLLAATVIGSLPGSTWRRRGAALGTAAVLSGVLVAWRPPWDPMVMNSGIYQYAPNLRGVSLPENAFASMVHEDSELLHYEEGLTANVVVGRQPSTGNIWMAINGKIDASSNKDLETQLLLGHLPMLLGSGSSEARRVVVIGYASGITTGAVTRHNPARVVAVEIEPAVLRASTYFDPFNHRPLSDPRVRAVEADGRRFLLADRNAYDVIISEPSSPWMTMAANLFTREFFEIGRRRLAPEGVFAQWIQIYGVTTDDLRSLVKTFATVFPHVTILWTTPGQDMVLLGSAVPLQMDIGRLETMMASPEVAQDLARVNIRSVPDLLTYHIVGDAEVHAFVGDAKLNTDDNALIEFRAPLTMHAWERTGAANRSALEALAVDPLALGSNVPVDSAARAGLYANLGEAFAGKKMMRRAVEALRRAQKIHPTERGARLLTSYEAGEFQSAPSK
jgi:spermidine synthase